VAGAHGRVRLDVGPQVEVAVADGLAVGERAHAVVRPEKLRIDVADADVPDGAPSVAGEVESSVYLGTSTQIVVRLGGGVRMTVLVPNADEALRQRLPGGGARVRLSWAPEHIHVVRESGGGPGDAELRPTAELAIGNTES
jgi:ABC-type Fe3+/spermidine/putrescine transport system ATPase subunit